VAYSPTTWVEGVTTLGPTNLNKIETELARLKTNADLDPAAAIAYSKLALALSIVNGDISSSAAIAYSKLNLAASIVNADISASAAISASKISAAATSYTPSWTSTGTQPAIGNGSIAGSYVQIGKIEVASASIVAGSTTTYGTGNYSLSLPIAPAAVSTVVALGVGSMFLSGGSSINNILWVDNGRLLLNQLAFAQVTPTSPITLASGSEIHVSATYVSV